MIKVFLGGTCNSDWRKRFIPLLDKDNVEYYNPLVTNWNDEARRKEEEFKATSDYNLYVIDATMSGVFSIAEVVDDSNKKPKKTIFCVNKEPVNPPLNKVFTKGQLISLQATQNMIENNGAYVCDTLEECAELINKLAKD